MMLRGPRGPLRLRLLLRHQRSWAASAPVAPVAYNLIADAATFAVSGPAVGLTVSRGFRAGTGVFAVSDPDAVLSQKHTLTAGPAAFSLVGISQSLTQSRKIVAGVGAIAVGGGPALLGASRAMAASPGQFTLAGQAAELRATLRGPDPVAVSAVAGGGSPVEPPRAVDHHRPVRITLRAGPGAFYLSLIPAKLAHARTITAPLRAVDPPTLPDPPAKGRADPDPRQGFGLGLFENDDDDILIFALILDLLEREGML